MAENITLNNVATFQNDTTAVNVVNNNNAAITTAFVDVLSRSGVSPNPMLSTLDMNNNQIVNLPFPTTLNSPARLADVTNAQNISIISATTGTSGHVVPFLDGTNTWSAPQTFNAFGIGTTTGLTLGVSTGVVTSGSSYNAGIVNFTDAINVGANFSNGFTVNQAFGGSTLQGGRAGLNASLTLTSATNAANPNRNYLAVQGIAFGNSADGGTNPNSIGTSAGLLFGGFFQSNLGSSSTSLQQASALGGSITMAAGSSAWAKTLLQLSSNPADAVNGSAINTMIWLNNDPGSTAKWTNAILIDNQGGIGTFPIATTGTIFKTGTGSCATGIDFTSTTFSGNPFQSVNFSVTSAGIISSGSNGASNGTLQLFGLTSGNLTLFSNNTANLLTISQPVQIGVIGTTAGTLNLAGQTSGSAQLSCSATGSLLQLGAGNVSIDTAGVIGTNGVVKIATSTGLTAGGSTSLAYFATSVVGFGIYFGSGAPTITAAKGSLYLRSDGTTTITRAYINTDGATTWTAITTVA